VAEGDFLQRIDAQIARTNEMLEQDRAAWRRAMDAHGDDLNDIRFEQRQVSLRGERIAQGHLRVLEDMSDRLRANTRAVLSMLDKFEGGGGPASSGA
jgi:hypothetical protein